jgi:hypothetical protein
MNRKCTFFAIALTVSSAALTTNASAQGKTRPEVRQELIDAQNNGLNFVTDTLRAGSAAIIPAAGHFTLSR